jgi:hypothetical protein
MDSQKRKKPQIKLPFIMLFWGVMAMGIGSSIWLVRVLIIIQQEGIYMANEINPLILSSEIVFFMIGIFLSVIMLFKISKILLEKLV